MFLGELHGPLHGALHRLRHLPHNLLHARLSSYLLRLVQLGSFGGRLADGLAVSRRLMRRMEAAHSAATKRRAALRHLSRKVIV